MNMLIALIIPFITLFAPDKPKWQELTAFEIYSKVSISKFQKMSDAEIQKMPHKLADINEAKKILSLAKPQFTPIIWKGMAYLAIARYKDGSSRKILINSYGSSFRDDTGKQNYTLEENAGTWHSFSLRISHK